MGTATPTSVEGLGRREADDEERLVLAGAQPGPAGGVGRVIGLAITLLLGLGLTQLKFVTSNASYLNTNDQARSRTSTTRASSAATRW